MLYPRISVRHAPLHKEDKEPYIADIVTIDSDHHGIASSPHEALRLATEHWHAYEERKAAGNGDTNGQ